MDQKMIDIYNLIQELAWLFGDHGFNGECCRDLTFVEYMALKRIEASDQITVQETGRALNFTKSGASKIIDRLENKGYVARQVSPLDGRVCCISPTTQGKSATAEIIEQYTTYLDKILEELGPAEISNIRSALQLLVESAHNQAEWPVGGVGR